MDYWLHRLAWQEKIAYPLVERGILTIGFNEVSDRDTIKADRDELKDILNKCYKWTGNSLGQNVGVLYRFLRDFKVGDFVVVPKNQSREFGIFEILDSAKIIDDIPIDKLEFLNVNLIPGSGLQYIGNTDFIDLGFFIKVRAVTHYDSSAFIPCENKFLYSILSKKGQLTNVSLNDL